MVDRTGLTGVIHGKIIQLEHEPGLPDGQPVTVVVQPDPSRLRSGEGIRGLFGGWVDDAEELDRFLEWNRQERKLSRRDLPA